MNDWSPLEEDVLLTGTLTVIVRDHRGRPLADKQVEISGCGFV
jgi:hypothetical protein